MIEREVEGLIVGGGPSGLALAWSLQGNTLVLEKESTVGGLCRSIHHDGGVFDIGGHSFHSPHPEVYELVKSLLGDRLYVQRRDARVFSHGTLIPYPFQKFFDQLPDPEVVRACAKGLEDARTDGRPPRNFEEFIVKRFGRGIADHFMLPYNRKLWARPIDQMSCEWTSERVAGPQGQQERFDTEGGRRRPLQADTEVAYPSEGGFEEIYRSFVPFIPALELNSEVVEIDRRRRLAMTRDGRVYRWRYLVSTMPLPMLAEVVHDTPAEIRELASQLEYLSLRVDLLLTSRPLETPIQRIYVADPEIPPHKIALNHNSSDSLRARPRHAIMAEVSLSPAKEIERSEIASKTAQFLCDVGVLESPDDISWSGHVDVEFGYPVYTHARPGLVAEIKEWLKQHDIYTLGRFGDWEYINSDKCVMKALNLGRELKTRFHDDVTVDSEATSFRPLG